MKNYKTNLPFQIHGTSMFQDGLSEGKIGGVVEGNFTNPFVDQGDPEWERPKVKSRYECKTTLFLSKKRRPKTETSLTNFLIEVLSGFR